MRLLLASLAGLDLLSLSSELFEMSTEFGRRGEILEAQVKMRWWGLVSIEAV